MTAATIISLVSTLISAAVAVLVAVLNRRMARQDKEKDALTAARVKNETLLIKLSMASLALGEATAEAVQRIPDAHCNGEMHEALDFAKATKKEYREFERQQTAESLQ